MSDQPFNLWNHQLQEAGTELNGMRPEECHCLRWENIDWAGGRNGALLIVRGETKAARRVLPLTTRVRIALENRWNLAGPTNRGLGVARRHERRTHKSRQLETPTQKSLKLAKVRPFEVCSIRHTFLTRLGESGCDTYTLARIAGHSNISISQRYVHRSEDAVLNALSRLSGPNSRHSGESLIPARSEELLLNTANPDS